MGTYTYLACDLITGNVRERVDLIGVTAQRTLDQTTPGQFSAQMPLTGLIDRETGAPNRVLQQSRIDATEEGRSTIVVVRDGVALGEWIIWDRPDRPNNGTPITLSGAYITSYLDEVIPVFTGSTGDLPAGGWVGVEQLTIARQLALQVADPITSTFAPAGSRGIALSVPIPSASGTGRTLTDGPGKYQTVLRMLTALAALPGGFDWDIDVQLVTVGSTQQVQRTLNLSYPRRGIDAGITLQPAEGKPGGNVTRFSAGGSGKRIATQYIGLGAGHGPGQAVTTSPNTALISAYPLMQSVYTDTSVYDPAVMQMKSDAQAMNARSAMVPPKVQVLADADPVLGSYRCGDYMTVVAGQSTNFPNGYSQRLRLSSFTIAPPKAGAEVVDLTLALIPEV